MSDLKPCPFCGGKALSEHDHYEGFQVVCEYCAASTEYFFTRPEAEKTWNTRADGLVSVDELTKAQQEIEEYKHEWEQACQRYQGTFEAYKGLKERFDSLFEDYRELQQTIAEQQEQIEALEADRKLLATLEQEAIRNAVVNVDCSDIQNQGIIVGVIKRRFLDYANNLTKGGE